MSRANRERRLRNAEARAQAARPCPLKLIYAIGADTLPTVEAREEAAQQLIDMFLGGATKRVSMSTLVAYLTTEGNLSVQNMIADCEYLVDQELVIESTVLCGCQTH